MRHTPAPWIVVEEVAIDYRPQQILGRGGDSRVAVCLDGGPKFAVDKAEERANARLIAAAPDLLAACEFAMKVIEHGDFKNGVTDPSGLLDEGEVRVSQFYEELRTLVARATGGTP